ncbi:MAG: IS3 family transposase [Acidobacteriota bacterium]|nr:IS3 family transposase [Acidobacteriota bacterium]
MTQMINLEQVTPPALSVSRLCSSLSLSRAEYYRHSNCPEAPEPDIDLRQAIHEIAADMPAYGYRRITAQLVRNGIVANHKRVLKLMRKDGLLCNRKPAFVNTTQSQHSFTIYPNLVPSLVIDSSNQLWVADITYIHLRREVFYLAVVLDAFSRRVIGWHMDSTLGAQLAVAALQMALSRRTITLNLVHHSDRGVQYASNVYVNLLKEHGIRISMSRGGNPYDNAQAERFIKTLKYEEVYLNEYENRAEARFRIGEFLEQIYNHKRLHSRLGYVPPAEFEQSFPQSTRPQPVVST